MKNLVRVFLIGFVFTCFLTVGFAGKLTPAEEMTRCLPEGTLGFVASSGTDSVGPAFKKSALGKVLANDQVKEITDYLLPKFIEIAEKEGDQEDVENVKLFMELAKVVSKCPFIAGVSENPSGGKVPISAFFIVDAGPVRYELTPIIKKIDTEIEIVKKRIGSIRMNAVKVFEDQYVWWGFVGEKFVFAVNDNEGLVLKNLSSPSKTTPKNLSKIPQTGDAFIINYDFKAILSLVERSMKDETSEDFKDVMAVIEELGLAKMGNISARVGFSGANVVAGKAVEIPSPRSGLFACAGNIDMSIFDLVEPRAVKAGAANFDIAKCCDVIINAVKKVIPETDLNQAAQQIAGFEKMTNINIREGILDSIAGEGVYYVIPAGVMMQSPSGGFVAIARLKDDGTKFQESMKALGQFAAAKSEGMLQISSLPKGDVTINTWTVMPLAMMQVMPCWAIVDGNVIMASNAVLCGKAIDRVKSDDPSKDSLSSTAAFKSAVKGLPEEITALTYTDSKVQFTQLTMQLQRVWPMISMGLMQQGIKLPAMLPNFDDVIKELTPSASYSWFDKDGAYSRYEGSGIEVGAGSVGGGAMGVAILMPALGKTKKLAQRLVSGTNLKGLANALNVYAFDHKDNYPANLDILIKEYDVGPKSFISPLKPDDFDGPSYIYIAGQKATSHPANIIIYENPAYLFDGTNVLYADGHAAWVKPDKFIKDLKATYKRLGKEAPEIKFLGDIIEKKNGQRPRPVKPKRAVDPSGYGTI